MQTRFTFQPAPEFITTTPPDQWLVEDVIPASGVLLICGDEARSLFTLTMAATLASDAPTWHDHPISHRPRGVAYAVVPNDDSPRSVAYTAVRNRIKAWGIWNEARAENLHIIREQPDLRNAQAVDALIDGFLTTVGKGGVLVFNNLPAGCEACGGTLQRIAQQIDGLVVVCADVEPNLAAASDSVIRIDGDAGTWFVEKDFVSGVPNAGGSFATDTGYASDRVCADVICVYPWEIYPYGIRQEPFGWWSLINCGGTVLETIAKFDPALAEGLLVAQPDPEETPCDLCFFTDETDPHRSKENLARYEAVLNKAFGGELPRSARIALEAARVSQAQQARR